MKKLWQMGWRVALCGLLLTWIFHSIFVDEARRATDPENWQVLDRVHQWQKGWVEGPPILWRNLSRIDPLSLAFSFVLMGLTLILGAIRWQMALHLQGLQLAFGRVLEISLVAHFFNSLLLGATGGDLMKAYYAARETRHRKTEAVTTVFVDRLIGLWAMLIFAGLMMIVGFKQTFEMDRVGMLANFIVAGMLIGCTGLVGLSFWGGVSKRWAKARIWFRKLPKGAHLERSLDACRQFGKERGFLAKVLTISTLLNVVIVLQWWVVGQGLASKVAFGQLLGVVPVVICVAALPVTPSGLGVRENLFVHMLASSTFASSALSLSLLAYAGSLFWSIIGGGVYLLFRDRHQLSRLELHCDGPDR